MTDLRQAAQQALEALESSRVFVTTREKTKHPEGTEWYDSAITALTNALEQQAAPVYRKGCVECDRAKQVQEADAEWKKGLAKGREILAQHRAADHNIKEQP